MRDSTTRFSDRVEDYIAYRPGYPPEAIEWLISVLDGPELVAEVGAGTGICTRALHNAGVEVIAVEPNDAMRAAGKNQLQDIDGVTWVEGTAEETGLDDHCVDAIVAAQAFHWFEPKATAKEWRRISKPPHRVGLIWNQRLSDVDSFSEAYEELLARRATDYKEVDHRRSESRIEAFFPSTLARATFPNAQEVDWAGFRGRAASSSYVPAPGHPGHDAFYDALRGIFEEHARSGRVTIRYATNLYVSTL